MKGVIIKGVVAILLFSTCIFLLIKIAKNENNNDDYNPCNLTSREKAQGFTCKKVSGKGYHKMKRYYE